jgi:two-component system, LuxR family, sensor kinase FixL
MISSNLLEGLKAQALFNAMADAMLLVDDAGCVTQANTSALEVLGYSKNEIIGLKVEALMPSSYRKRHQQYRENFIDKPQKRSMGNGKNLSVLARDGSELLFDIGLSPIVLDDRNFVLVTFHANEKQIEAESSLKASEERLRLAKLAAGLGVFDIDLIQNKVTCDEQVRKLWGFSSSEIITYELFIGAIHELDRASRQTAIDKALCFSLDGEYRTEFRVINILDKSQHWLFTAGKVFSENGKARRLLGVAQDITERKLLEQNLNTQRIDLEGLAKQQVAIQTASAIAHEINQPLAAISAYSEVALFALGSSKLDMDRLKRSLEGCVEQSQRAGKSLHELLEFLQKGEIEVTPVDINKAVQEAIHIVQNNGYGGFHTTLDLEPDLPKALANYTQLQKVLVNIVRNGVEAVHNAGLPIAAIKVTVKTLASSGMAQVTIQDNGPGLGDENMKRIFEPFFTTKPKGIGMGLAVSRALVEANGGQLWFDPDSSTGATFHFTLPLEKTWKAHN